MTRRKEYWELTPRGRRDRNRKTPGVLGLIGILVVVGTASRARHCGEIAEGSGGDQTSAATVVTPTPSLAANVPAVLSAPRGAAAELRPRSQSGRPGTQALADDPRLDQFARTWAHALVVQQGGSGIGEFYADNPHFRSGGPNATRETVARYWSLFFASGDTWTVDMDRSTWLTEATPLSAPVEAACGDDRGADGPTYTLRLWATEIAINRDPSIGCPQLQGIYLLRVRQFGGRLRICYESWSLDEGVCASCPTARVCTRRH